MNKLLKIGAAAMLAAATLVGCSSSKSSEGSEEKPQEILIGISPDYMPYEGLDEDGKLEGFDIDMTKWLFDYMNENGHNYSYEFKELSFDTIITALQSDQIDLGISGFTYDEEREGLFSDSYYDSAQVMVVNADSDIQSSKDLNGKLVGAQQGATGEDVANDIEGAEVQAMQDVKVLMESLKAKGLDAVVIDQAVADNYAANGDYKVLDEKLLDEENIIYTTEKHKDLLDDINKAIEAFKASDDYQTLVKKWFGASGEVSE
ncbi:transporter substrate-binding domain-containing protein [Dubosiella newyorkensis]|uniref:transporter substrate-binding domain-containing protein n=1 Tax=Dubosiella newyorkensis TaxID=1862672 RepID=UPI0023F55E0A|nr:transporter substrate-binding domain-containing protein [Dubosiella newyorkensis]